MTKFIRVKQSNPEALATADSKTALKAYGEDLANSITFWTLSQKAGMSNTPSHALACTIRSGMVLSERALHSDAYLSSDVAERLRQRLLRDLAMTRLYQYIANASRQLLLPELNTAGRVDMVPDLNDTDLDTPESYRLHVGLGRAAACFGEMPTQGVVWRIAGSDLYVKSRLPAEFSGSIQDDMSSGAIRVVPNLVTLTPYLPARTA